MAVWVSQHRGDLVLRSWPIVRFTAGIAMAVGLFIPRFYDFLDGDSSSESAWPAIVLLLVALLLSPVTRVREQQPTQRICWRRLSLWGISRASLSTVTSLSIVRWPGRGPLRRVVAVIGDGAQHVSIPLGWAWRGRVAEDSQHAIQALRGMLNCHEEEEEFAVPKRKLTLRRLLAATTTVAAVLAWLLQRDWSTGDTQLPSTLGATLLTLGGTLLFRVDSAATPRFLLTLCVLYGPLAWLIPTSQPWGQTSGLLEGALLFPGIPVLYLTRSAADPRNMWYFALVVIAIWIVSCFAARAGWKWTLPWAALVFAWGCFSSLLLHALFRA